MFVVAGLIMVAAAALAFTTRSYRRISEQYLESAPPDPTKEAGPDTDASPGAGADVSPDCLPDVLPDVREQQLRR